MSTMTAPPPQATQQQKSKAASSVKIALSGDPSVQLLPPSIRDRAISRSRMRTGVLLVILGLIVALGLFAAASLRATEAHQALLRENNRGSDLLAQQAQYADAVALDRLIAQAKQLQQATAETEVDLGPLLKKLIATLPAGGEIAELAALNYVPWEAMPGEDEDATRLASAGLVASFALHVNTTTIQDATNYSRAIRELPGALDSTITEVAVGVDGRVTSVVTLFLGRDAVSGRFAAQEGEQDADGADAAGEPADETDEQEG